MEPEGYRLTTSKIPVFLRKTPADFGVDVYQKSTDVRLVG